MALFDRIARGMTRASAGVPSYGLIPPLGSIQSASGLLVSQATAMTVSAVYAAVTLLAKDVARCRPGLFRRLDNGSYEEVIDHPVSKLLRRPNRIQTWFEFCRDMVAGYQLRGNGYAAILIDRRGDPAELILINPDAVMMLEAPDGSIFYNVNRIGLFQIAMLRDFPVAIPAESVLHLRGLSFNMLIGVSTIGLARDAIGLAMGQSQQASRWIGNGARPSVVLETEKQLNDATAKRLKANWDQINSGLQNTGGTAVLEEGLKAKTLQLTATDIAWIEQCNLTIQDISRFWNVPTRKLGQPDMTRGSTIIQEEQVYVNSAIAPILDMIEQKFEQTFDLEKEELVVRLDDSALLRADALTRYNLGRVGKLSGLITTNEWRRGERLPPVAGGDEVMQPVNMAALGSDMTGTAPDAAGRPAEGQEPQPGVPNQKKKPGAVSDDAPE